MDHMPQKEDDMLVVTRKPHEAVIIGDEVTVVVLSVKGNQVRIGIQAPKNVSVHREEVYDVIRRGSGSSPALDRKAV
jgi:carbon storage regulator